MPFCKKHPKTELVIRQGKRNQNFVVCPECKPDPKKTAPLNEPPAPAEEKKNGQQPTESGSRPWYDRPIL